MNNYQSTHTGPQIDTAVENALSPKKTLYKNTDATSKSYSDIRSTDEVLTVKDNGGTDNESRYGSARVTMEVLRAEFGAYEAGLLRDEVKFYQGTFSASGEGYKLDVRDRTTTPNPTMICTNLMRTRDVILEVPQGFVVQAYYGNANRERAGEAQTANGQYRATTLEVNWQDYEYVRFACWIKQNEVNITPADVAIKIVRRADQGQDLLNIILLD